MKRFLLLCFVAFVAFPVVVSAKRTKHQHTLQLNLTAISDHTGLDSGLSPELRYGYKFKRSLSMEMGLRLAPEGSGNFHRLFFLGRVHLPLFPRSDMNFQFGWTHTAFHGLQKGDNMLMVLHELNAPYFYFYGGIGLRYYLMNPEEYTNPFKASANFMESFFLFDIRGQYTFRFPRLRGASLQLGAGLMNFLVSDILNSNNVGYQLVATWKQPGIGEFGVHAGMRSYSFWALAGYFGRLFLFFSYKHHFRH